MVAVAGIVPIETYLASALASGQSPNRWAPFLLDRGRGQSVPPTGNIAGQLLLLAVLLAAGGAFLYRVWRLYRPLLAAQPTVRRGDEGTRVRRVLTMVLGQSKLFERPVIGVAHFLIFWGFIILTLALLQVLADGLIHGVHLPIVSSRFYIALNDALAAVAAARAG
jgi:hypothetical protein